METIYALADANGLVWYVGVTADPDRRLNDHLALGRRTAPNNNERLWLWLRSFVPKFEVLEVIDEQPSSTEQQGYPKRRFGKEQAKSVQEAKWIEHYRVINPLLLNQYWNAGRPAKDMTGQRVNHWTVLERSTRKGYQAIWTCRCDCGAIKDIRADHLRNGQSKSCGCVKRSNPSSS